MHDDQTASIHIGDNAVHGRVLRMGEALNTVLGGDRYPVPVARLLGEAILIAALVSRALKFKGKLYVQAHGTNEGAVSLLTAECTTDGDIRAYARFDAPSLEKILSDNPQPDAKTLLGGGTFAMTIDQGTDMDRYQGLSAIDGASLGDCAEHYFAQSEQVPTRIQLSVGQLQNSGEAMQWRGAGIMIQKTAGDKARGDTAESWDMARALMETLGDVEMLDPDLSTDNLLYRLFHEQGVRREDPIDVRANCSCSRERLHNTLKSFGAQAISDMTIDGKITANCEYCNADHVFDPADI